MSWTNKTKSATAYTNKAKGDVRAHLWSPNNDNIWGEDNLPWQDEETEIGTDWLNKAKNTASFTNKAKS